MSVLLFSHRACMHHDMGPHHPECPDRLRAVLRALDQEEFSDLIRDEAPQATVEQLTRVHPQRYVEAILGIRPEPDDLVPLDGDTLMNWGSAEAALLQFITVSASSDTWSSGSGRMPRMAST